MNLIELSTVLWPIGPGSDIVAKRRAMCAKCRYNTNKGCAKNWKVSVDKGVAKCFQFEPRARKTKVNLLLDIIRS